MKNQKQLLELICEKHKTIVPTDENIECWFCENERLRDVCKRVLAWLDHPALSRVCSIADVHGFGIRSEEARVGHSAIADLRDIIK